MLDGKNVWNQWFQTDMGELNVGSKCIYSFPNMKNSVYEMLKDTAKRYPDRIGIYDNWNRNYNYREFLAITDSLAAYLKYMMKVKKGQRIGLLLFNGMEFASAYYALSKIGAVAAPLPTKYKEPEIRALIEKADLTGIMVSSEYIDWVISYQSQGIFVIPSQNEMNGYGFGYLFENKPWESMLDEERSSLQDVGLDDELILMFTSGTTSISKGVVLKNYNVNHAVMIYQRILGLNEEDKTVIPVPLYHITGLVALLSLFVYIGGAIHLYKRYDAKRVLQGIVDNEITFLHGSPTVFGLFLDYKKEYASLPSIRKLACGGSYMPVEVIKKLHCWMPNMEFQNVYGMTETASPGTIFPYDAATSLYPASQGKPIPGLQLKIVDDNQKEVQDGTVGNIFLRGGNVCEYYYNMESPLITADGWLDTGDMGYINEDSYVFIVDRKKDMINRGGEKIWCTDVEEVLISLQGVKDAAVVGIPNEVYGEVAAAVVVLEERDILTEETIQKDLKNKIAAYKIPERILFAGDIPKTPGLKTDKKRIKKMFDYKE